MSNITVSSICDGVTIGQYNPHTDNKTRLWKKIHWSKYFKLDDSNKEKDPVIVSVGYTQYNFLGVDNTLSVLEEVLDLRAENEDMKKQLSVLTEKVNKLEKG